VNPGVRRSLITVIAVSLVALSGCASGSGDGVTPTATATKSALPAPTVLTRITVKAPSCEACVVTLFRALAGQQIQTDYVLGSGTVENGQIAFEIPTASTPGLAFGIRNVGGGYQAKIGQPFLVVGYGGRPQGTRVSQAAAPLQRTGSWCWSGTKERNFVINLRSERFFEAGKSPSKIVSFWASPTLGVPIWKANLKLTYRGGIGIVGVPFCQIGH
jgi:hypothetical protein